MTTATLPLAPPFPRMAAPDWIVLLTLVVLLGLGLGIGIGSGARPVPAPAPTVPADAGVDAATGGSGP
jgi:hypothetical protein